MDINQYSEEYIKFVTDHFINSMTAQISRRVTENVVEVVNKFDVKNEIDRQVNNLVANAVNAYQSANLAGAAAVGQNIVTGLQNKSQEFIDNLTTEIKNRVINDFYTKINAIDVNGMVREQCNILVANAISSNTLHFPDRSIPGSALKDDDIHIKADNILPGIIKRFTSTGIEDLSTSSQVTITDTYSIFENKLVAAELEVTGQFYLTGGLDPKLSENIADLAVKKIEQTYSDGTFDQYVHRVLSKIDEEGIDSTKVKVQGKPIVENSALAQNITVSNLRKVGLLNELEVAGEVLFDDTLYVRSGKVGINTMEPDNTLDVWDQEVQLVANKKQQNTMFLGTIKNQSLILGTLGKDQLTLLPNGDILVDRLSIGKTRQSSAPWEPTDNRQAGEIVWNEQPQLGQPIGWVSLGGSRWAKFGIITE